MKLKLTMLCLVCAICTLTAFSAQADETSVVPAPLIDNTETIVQEFEAEGLESIGTIRSDKQPVTLKFFVTESAQKLMDAGTFDVEDNEFDQAKFETFVAQKFGNALAYLLERADNWPAQEIYLLLSDTGDERQYSTASVIHRSRVVEIDLRRWHKAWRTENFMVYETTPVHELTHVLQWFSDQNDTRYQRELSANLVEIAYLRYRVGSTDPIFTDYLSLNGPPPTRAQLLDPDSDQSSAWRHLAFKLVSNCLDGTYQFTTLNAETDEEKRQTARIAALEKFAILYARHPAIGEEGFAAACRESGLLDAAGKPLTLDTLRHDTARDFASATVEKK